MESVFILSSTSCSLTCLVKIFEHRFASDAVSILQQLGLQMDERDEAAAPAEQVSVFYGRRI